MKDVIALTTRGILVMCAWPNPLKNASLSD